MNKNHILYLHLLRIIGAILVICMHTAAPLIYQLHQTSTLNWWNTNIINGFSRWVVPVFIMVSGTLLLRTDKVEQFTVFIKKRFSKIGIPFIFWFILYYILMYREHILSKLDLPTIHHHIFYIPPQYHLYFLYILLILYLLTPFLQKLLNSLSKRSQIIFIIISLLVTVTWRYQPLTILLWIPYIFYFTVPTIKELVAKYLSIKITIPLYILASIGIAYFTYYRFNTNQPDPVYFHEYHNPLVVLQATSIFMTFYLLEPFFEKHFRKYQDVIVRISNLTFGVYLIGILIQDLIWDGFRILNPSITSTALTINIQAILTIITSFSIIFVLQKIPIIKKIV